MTSGIVEINGASLYYEVAGTGPPIVLLHDGLLDCRVWDDQFEAFAGSHTVVRYDIRGRGRSGMSDKEFSHVEDLRALLGFLGVQRTSLIGASNGGRISLDFVLEYPEMADSLVLVGLSLSGYRFSEETLRRGLQSLRCREGEGRLGVRPVLARRPLLGSGSRTLWHLRKVA